MTTENRRADALTDAQRKSLLSHADEMDAYGWKDDAEAIRLLLAAPPASQPAAAPIDDCDDVHELAYEMCLNKDSSSRTGTFEFASENLFAFVRNAAVLMARTVPAPSPADERAAFDQAQFDCFATEARLVRRQLGIDVPAAVSDVLAEIKALQARAAARAASANETGAMLDALKRLHVGDSQFEGWFASEDRDGVNPKQLARDAYAAGMEDPLVMTVLDAVRSPAMAAEAEKPFGWAQPKGGNYFTRNESSAKRIGGLVPVYAAPQPAQADARVGLTGEQRTAIKAGSTALRKLGGFDYFADVLDDMLASAPMDSRTGSGS